MTVDIMTWDGEDPKTVRHHTLDEAVREDFVRFENNKITPQDESVIVRYGSGEHAYNVREMFEGDIIICDNVSPRYTPLSILFRSGAFRVNINIVKPTLDSFVEWCHVKVIGNIYEGIFEKYQDNYTWDNVYQRGERRKR